MSALLALHDVSKAFGGVRALRGVSFDVRPGEIHALVGENGAGKSTLVRIVTGALRQDAGTLEVGGQRVDRADPPLMRTLGVAPIYQQPALCPDLSVAENLALRLERGGAWRRVDWRARRERAAALLRRVGASIDVETPARLLRMAEQQLVEIAGALGADARLLLMDEPTAALTDREAVTLFALLRDLRARGAAIVYISHRLEEVEALADRVTVLRDGALVATRPIGEVTRAEMIRLMVGRDVPSSSPPREDRVARPVGGSEAPATSRAEAAPGVTGGDSTISQRATAGGSEAPATSHAEAAPGVTGGDPTISQRATAGGSEAPATSRAEATSGATGSDTAASQRAESLRAGIGDRGGALRRGATNAGAGHVTPVEAPGEHGLVVLSVERVGCRASGVRDVTLDVRAGEIVGLAGLVGAGRTELARVLFGLTPADSGLIRLGGATVRIDSPADAVRHGLAYVPEDRRAHGVVAELSVAANVTLASLRRLTRHAWLDVRQERAIAADYVQRFAIKTPSLDARVGTLSGGNQQKVALARWLALSPRVLVLDEPTQGVDIGAKAEIHRLIVDLAARGLAIVLISSELPEILGLSDRIAVMRGGTIAGTLSRAEATPDAILTLALGHMPVTPVESTSDALSAFVEDERGAGA